MKKKITAALFLLAISSSAWAVKMVCTDCYISPTGNVSCKTCDWVGPR
jgi:hypothetical protein